MSRTVTGPLEYPNGDPIGLATVKFVTSRNSYSADGSVPLYTEITTSTDAFGDMTINLNLGQYRVLLQENGADEWLTLGTIVVEAGASIELGSLIDASDTSTVLSFADIATQTWVAAYVLGGGSPGDIAITDLAVGTATASQYIKIDAGGTAIIGVDSLSTDAPRAFEYFYAHLE